MEPVLRNAIARIDIIEDGKSVGRGTGTLVAKGLVLTALHVVADRKAKPAVPYPGTIRLTFPTHTTEAVLDDRCFAPAADWALLVCVDPPGVRPMPLAELDDTEVDFVTYGFPDTQPRDGLVQRGTIENRHATLFGTPAYQLFSLQSAAGTGAPVKGASGSPVIVNGALIGVLRFALMNERKETRAGTLYACPLPTVIEACGERLPIPDPCYGLPGLPRRPLPATPVKHLQRFTSDDAEIFFGRNREIRQLFDRLTDTEAAPVVLFYGQSGAGKSSVLDAGLVPRLGWTHEVRYVRRERHRPLAASLGAVVTGGPVDGVPSPRAIVEAWQGVEEDVGRPLVVIVDQIEEIYTQPGEATDELGDFVRVLAALFGTPDTVGGRLVLSFRKEWFPELQKQLDQLKLGYGKVFLEGLDRAAIIEVVKGVTGTGRLRDQYGVALQAGLPELLADDLLDDRDSPIAPTLQILLSKLWESAVGEHRHAPAFTIDRYRRLRAQGALLGDFLDQQLDKLASDLPDAVASGLAIDVLAHHSTPLLTTRQCSRDELVETYRGRDDLMRSLVGALQDRFLLVEQAGDRTHESPATRLSHDTLAPLVRMRLDDSARAGQRARRIVEGRAQQWVDGVDGVAFDDEDLAVVEAGLDGMRSLTTAETRLVAASGRLRDRRRVRRRVLQTVAAVTAVVVVALLLTSLALLSRAREEQNLSELALTVPRVQERLAIEPGSGLVASLAAVGRSLDTVGPEPLGRLQFSLNQAMLEAREQELVDFGVALHAVAAHDDRIAVGTAQGAIRFSDFEGNPLPGRAIEGGHVGAVQSLAFNRTGNLIASAGDDGAVKVWDRTGTLVQAFPGHPGGVNTVEFLDEGRLLTGGRDGALRLWEVGSTEVLVWCHEPRTACLEAPVVLRDALAQAVEIAESVVPGFEYHDPNEVTAVAAAQSGGEWVLASAANDVVRLWTLDRRQIGPDLRGHTARVNDVDIGYDPSGVRWVVTGAEDETVRVWREDGTPDGEPIRYHRGPVNAVTFSLDARVVLSAGDDQVLFASDRGGDLAATPFRGFDGPVSDVTYSQRGAIAIVDHDGNLRLRDHRGNQYGRERRGRQSDRLLAVAFDPGGRTVVTGGESGELAFYSLNPEDQWEDNMGPEPLLIEPGAELTHTGGGHGARFSPGRQPDRERRPRRPGAPVDATRRGHRADTARAAGEGPPGGDHRRAVRRRHGAVADGRPRWPGSCLECRRPVSGQDDVGRVQGACAGPRAGDRIDCRCPRRLSRHRVE